MSDGKEADPHLDIESDTDDAPQDPQLAEATVAASTSGAGSSPPLWRDVPPPPPYEPETSWLCCTTYKDASKFKTILHYLDLSDAQKRIIETRYLPILQQLQKRTRNHAIVFFIGHFVITVGSLFVPALLSIQNSDKEYALTAGPFNVHMYWTTFAISLLVTIWNAILTLFRIDKKYYFLNTTLERLRSEGWQYVSLTGRYSGHLTKKKKPTHKNQFVHFTHYVERIKMKQIEEEYYRTDEKSQAPTTGAVTLPTGSGSTPPQPHSRSTIEPSSFSPPEPLQNMAHNDLPREVQTSLDYLRQTPAYHPALESTLSLSVPPVYPSFRTAPPAPPAPPAPMDKPETAPDAHVTLSISPPLPESTSQPISSATVLGAPQPAPRILNTIRPLRHPLHISAPAPPAPAPAPPVREP